MINTNGTRDSFFTQVYISSEARFYSIKDVKEMTGWSENTVQKLFNDPKFPSADYGKNKVSSCLSDGKVSYGFRQAENVNRPQSAVSYHIVSELITGHRKERGEVFSGFGPEAKRPNAGQKRPKLGI